MAVQLNVDVGKALKALGVDPAPLEAKGVKFVPYTGGVKFVTGNEVIASWAIAPSKIAEIGSKGYNDSDPLHKTIKGNLESTLKAVDDALGKSASDVKEPPLKAVVGGAIPEFSKAEMKTAAPANLNDATMLYQPVKGSTAGSRYFVVGLSTGIKVAARVKNNQTSIRVEGPKFASLSPMLIESGVFGPEFAGSFEKNYASMHVATPKKVDAQKVVGAVLSCLCSEIKHGVPDVTPIMEAA